MDTDDFPVIIRNVGKSTKASVNSDRPSVFGSSNFNDQLLNQSPAASGKQQQANDSSNIPPKIFLNKIEKFDSTDIGPFIVLLQSENNNIGHLHPMSIGKLILQEHRELDNIIYNLLRELAKIELRLP